MKKGLPTKYAKMGFAKGWAAYKKDRHIGLEGSKKRRKKSHRAIWLDGDMTTPAIVKRPLRSFSSITPNKIISPLLDLGLLIVGMALGAGIKKASPIKNPHLMNGAQAVLGVGGSLLTKNRFVKMPLLGVALQSTIAEAKMLFPKMVPIAGDDEVVYLPVNADDDQQLEFKGDDNRVGSVIDGELDVGDDNRVGSVIDGDDYGEVVQGEGGEPGEI